MDTLKNGNKYLTLVSTNKNKDILIKYTKLWDKIKKINGNQAGEYGKNFMKIKFNSDDNLPLNKISMLLNMTAVIRSVFQENGTYFFF